MMVKETLKIGQERLDIIYDIEIVLFILGVFVILLALCLMGFGYNTTSCVTGACFGLLISLLTFKEFIIVVNMEN